MDLKFLADQSFWVAIGSVATALAFVLAFTELIIERRARRSESRKAQARKISAWISRLAPSGPGEAVALNSSDSPVYRFLIFLVLAEGAGPRTGEELVGSASDKLEQRGLPGSMLVLPPGRQTVSLPEWTGGGMHRRPGVEIAFTDASGQHWIRRVDGRLEEIKTEAVAHYHLPMPGIW